MDKNINLENFELDNYIKDAKKKNRKEAKGALRKTVQNIFLFQTPQRGTHR